MPNPDPSLTPEEAAAAWIQSTHGRCSPYLDSFVRPAFLAGHAHATAQANHREFCANSARPGDVANLVIDREAAQRKVASVSARLKEVERERDQAGELFNEENERICRILNTVRDVDRAGFDNIKENRVVEAIKLAVVKIADDRDRLRAELEAHLSDHQDDLKAHECLLVERNMLKGELDRMQAEMELRAEEFCEVLNQRNEALAVVEKMRALLRRIQQDNDWPGKTDHIIQVLSTSSSLTLLEFAEEVWKEAANTGQKPDARNRQWLASPTYWRLTRATGEAQEK